MADAPEGGVKLTISDAFVKSSETFPTPCGQWIEFSGAIATENAVVGLRTFCAP
jgi:hypothetical protein